MKKIHSLVHRFNNPDFGILLVRLAIGIPFIYAGWYHIHNMAMTISFFKMVGINSFWTYVASYTELLGGIALVVGFWSRYAGILLAITMAVAIKVTWAHGFGLQNNGYEFALVLFLGSLAMVAFGSGKYSLSKCC